MLRRRLPRLPVGVILLLLRIFCGTSSVASAKEKVDYNFHIRPLLADRCYACHGPDPKQRKADLRLDTPNGAVEAGVIVPGKPDASEVVKRITASDKTHMPPRKSNLRLSQSEIDLIRQWIAEGAEYKPHWAFLPLPHKGPLPQVSDSHWPAKPLDHFVLARLDREELKPSPPAARADWIRRVTFDLTGLPPRRADVDAFLADASPRAFATAVDRLLASSQFGERMAQDWLDLARYADSFGYQADGDTHVWPWRDWVIKAFNENLSYDKFLTWQLAGDLLAHPTREQRLATAICRLNRMTNEGGSIAEEFRNEYVSDRVHTFATAFLGLTLECCRCHDHKYDPFTMADYYGLGAFFNNIDEWGTYDNSHFRPTPTLPLPTPAQDQELAKLTKEVAACEARLGEIEKSREAAFQTWLARKDHKPDIPGLIAHYPLDRFTGGNQLENLVDPKNPGTTSSASTLVPGKIGKALRFNGDDAAAFPKVAGSLDRGQPFTATFWLQTPMIMRQGVVFHCQSGTDTGFHGTELSFDDGRLCLAMIRFWPGNAMAVRTRVALPARRWVHIAVCNDGSSRAAGLRIHIDGKLAEIDVLRDHLSKNLEAGGGATYFGGQTGFTFGARFRSVGLKDGLLDDLRVFSRPLAPAEVAQVHDGETLPKALKSKDATLLRSYYLGAQDREAANARAQLHQARERLFAAQTSVFEIMTMREMPEPRQAYILARGAYDAPKNRPVARQTPVSLLPFPKDAPRNRLGLARWLTDPRHPLTARVAVNHFWQIFFGRGIVATTENFGTQGALPTHPELLDWLARDFIESGWDVKALCKEIVLSSTYRQRSTKTQQLRERDPDNLLLARGPSRRLSAEELRDTALAVGGLLVEKVGGPPVKPYQPSGLWREQNAFLPTYVPDKGEGLHRRSLYTFWRRTSPPPNMLTFDMPSREVCVVRRQTTSTPLQPLVLLNDPQFVEAARGLGERMLREGGGTQEERVLFAFRRAATRKPLQRELMLLTALYQSERATFLKDTASARKYLRVGEKPVAAEIDPVELAAATVVANAVLNLDAAMMIR